MKRDKLLKQVKQTVHEIEPEAEIILYGSRARGDANSESDWDFLILLDGMVLSSIVRSRQKWDTPLHQVTPLSKVIREQGILI